MSLTVQQLGFSYGKREVLKHISFHVEDGDFLVVLGPNGVGKSTLFRCMLGLLDGYSGSVLLDGSDIRMLSRRDVAARCAYIPQSHGAVFAYTALEIVLMGTTRMTGRFLSPGPQQLACAREAMERIGISHLEERTYARLSGGEQQLVMIARALSQKTRLLLMDEPTSALDFGNQEKILKLMKELSEQGYTIILSTHNPQHALSHSSKMLALWDGQVEACGDSQELLTSALLQKLYGIQANVIQSEHGPLIACG